MYLQLKESQTNPEKYSQSRETSDHFILTDPKSWRNNKIRHKLLNLIFMLTIYLTLDWDSFFVTSWLKSIKLYYEVKINVVKINEVKINIYISKIW